ncbi:hypothetical protein N7535_000003 [Penicillium sp. DV-2018c]|nr:hypothetical protein N7461_006748 [Penicillium sp. DV-2018c]KAJ5581383.1 hypothetical protein N7535_000003 [Penicillium sp. DV-2018c]
MQAYLRKFMLHTEVSAAIRQKKPLESIAYSWIGGEDTMAVPDNPSSRLDAIGVSVAELQASYTQFVKQGEHTTSKAPFLKEWIANAKSVDAELLTWAETVPHHWRPVRLISGRDIDSSIPTYQSVCEVYPSCQIASIWNLWRCQRLLLAKTTLGALSALSDLGCFGSAPGQVSYHSTDFVKGQQVSQEVVDRVCYSIPFYLGNRTTPGSLTDFTDPMVILPSHYSSEACSRLTGNGLDAGISMDDHRRHVIAQGPWRAMHPLSHLLTLLSDDHADLIPNFPRPGQQKWIRDQFLRVALLLHLPGNSGHSAKSSGSMDPSADFKARYLASGVRKGAILMSGP